MYARIFLLAAGLIAGVSLVAQPRFSVDDTLRDIRGGTTGGVLHHFIQAHNWVGDTLHMRWHKAVKGQPPGWKVNFADPQQNYPDISGIDTADFVLPDSTHWTYNKFVIGIMTLGHTGYGHYIFTVYERNFPADSVRLHYDVLVSSGVGAEEWDTPRLNPYPNPAQHELRLPGWPREESQISLTDISGRKYMRPVAWPGGEARVDLRNLPPGHYVLRYNRGNGWEQHNIIIQ